MQLANILLASRALGAVAGLAALCLSGCDTENHASRASGNAASSVPRGATTPVAPVSHGPRKSTGDVSGAVSGVSSRSAERPSAGGSSALIQHLNAAQLLRLVEDAKLGTVVNVWATWCGPCREELPMLKAVAAKLAPEGIRLVLVSVDEPESEAKIPETLARYGFEPPFYVASRPLGAFKRAVHPVWPGNIPVTFLFDRKGDRRYFWGGPVMEKEVVPILEGLIQGRQIDGEARFELAPGQTTD